VNQNKLLKNEVEEVHNIYLTMRGWRMEQLSVYLRTVMEKEEKIGFV